MTEETWPTVAELRRKDREVAQAYAKAVLAADTAAIYAAAEMMDLTMGLGGTWRAAFRMLARSEPSPAARDEFLSHWITNGDTLRDRVPELLMIDALWKLLPPYNGPALDLFRGDASHNRRRRTYGASWSAERDIAETFARFHARFYQQGSVLLHTRAPPEAIICAVHLVDDRYGETEYVVDRRKLGKVVVLERFPADFDAHRLISDSATLSGDSRPDDSRD